MGDPRSRRSLSSSTLSAHFYAEAQRPIYIQMPAEDPRASDGDGVAVLRKSLYGTQDAAANWENEYSKTLVAAGYARGKASGCHFFHPGTKCKVLVHGDDYVGVGDDAAVRHQTLIHI